MAVLGIFQTSTFSSAKNFFSSQATLGSSISDSIKSILPTSESTLTIGGLEFDAWDNVRVDNESIITTAPLLTRDYVTKHVAKGVRTVDVDGYIYEIYAKIPVQQRAAAKFLAISSRVAVYDNKYTPGFQNQFNKIYQGFNDKVALFDGITTAGRGLYNDIVNFTGKAKEDTSRIGKTAQTLEAMRGSVITDVQLPGFTLTGTFVITKIDYSMEDMQIGKTKISLSLEEIKFGTSASITSFKQPVKDKTYAKKTAVAQKVKAQTTTPKDMGGLLVNSIGKVL